MQPTAAENNGPTTDRRAADCDVQSLTAVLDQIDQLLAAMSDEAYTAASLAGSSAIGGHVRHVLDHAAAWCAAADAPDDIPTIDYEARERDTDIERDRTAARRRITTLIEQLSQHDARWPARQAWVIQMINAQDAPLTMPSSMARELAFVISHTIHHQAIIAQVAQALSLTLPEGFGYAPGTLAHLRRAGV